MCIKIIRSHETVEFEPLELLEQQIGGAKQVVIDYDPDDSRIQCFMEQMDRIVKTGVGCQINIKVNNNKHLNGIKLDRQLKKFSVDLDVNEVVKTLVNNYSETDKRLSEIQEMCLKEK